MRIDFGAWRPDVASYNSAFLAEVRNAFFTASGWLPEKALVNVSEQPTNVPVQGIFSVRRRNGDLELFIATNGRLRRVPSRTGALEDVSNSGGYSTSFVDRFRGVQFGDLLVVTNLVQPIQAYELGGAAADFADLSATAPRARHMAIVRDLIAVAHLNTVEDGEDQYGVAWHGFTDGIPDPTNWTPSVETQADRQRISDIGAITGLTGGEFGTVVGTDGVARMTYVGSPLVYQFDVVERRLGCRLPQSVTQYRQVTFFYSPSGFMAFDGSSLRPIGNQKVDRFFAADLDEARCAEFMWAAPDLERQVVRWLYPARNMRVDRANKILTYHVDLDEWSLTEIEAQAIGTGRTFGADLDDPNLFPDLDATQVDLDDPRLWETMPATVAIDDNRVRIFAGGTLPGRFRTSEVDLNEGRRTMLQRLQVIQDRGSSSLRVIRRERYDRSFFFEPETRTGTSGIYELRVPGQTHAFEVTCDADWKRAIGIDVTGRPLGIR